MDTPSGYIYDGYEADGYVAEKAGFYPGVAFRYRPVLTQDKAVTMLLIANADARKGEEIAAAFVERQLISWDMAARLRADETEPQPVPIRSEHLLRLHPTLFAVIYRIIMGDVAGDVNPSDAIPEETGA